tara:strand:- start:181 stop:873 length:693 start_codon:yes stop_codon:yes gene_type:complete
MNYYYYILFLSFIIPFLFSFHPKIKFYKEFRILIKSITFTAIPFIIWDFIFAELGVWGFNQQFITGFYLYNLPIEEVLFFFIIPFCCIFTYYIFETNHLSFFNKKDWLTFNSFIAIVLIVIAIANAPNRYTFYCFMFCAMILLIDNYYIKIINYNYFNTVFIILFIPFFIVNGALTGLFFDQMVVWYNSADIIGIRLITIPFEDNVYSYQLLLLNLMFFNYYRKIEIQKS